jgi:hypothetical protein
VNINLQCRSIEIVEFFRPKTFCFLKIAVESAPKREMDESEAVATEVTRISSFFCIVVVGHVDFFFVLFVVLRRCRCLRRFFALFF